MAVQIQIRRDTADNWVEHDPILAQGEFGYEIDTDKIKIGDGIVTWNNLPYHVGDVKSVSGKTGHVILDKQDVGLGDVDNTSDSAKPISTATQTALNTKVDKVAGKGLSTEDYTTAEKTKLSGIATGATANDTDANLKNRANHTGTQTASTISDFSTATDARVSSGISTHVAASDPHTQYQKESEKGSANGYAELDATGKVPSGQLPSFVDDVVEAANYAALPVTGEAGKIYVTLDDNKTYRWGGSAYIEISSSLALCETSTTATATLAVNTFAIANYASGQLVYTLPATAPNTSSIQVYAMSAGGFRITAPSGDNILFPNGTNTGSGGYIDVPQYGMVQLRCTVANTTWNVVEANVAITNNNGAKYSGSSTWGSITGTLSDQTDLDTALNGKQASDATLTALASYNTNGLLTQTAADTFAGRTITGTANQITVTDGDGVSGNPTLSTPQDIHTGASPTFAGENLTDKLTVSIPNYANSNALDITQGDTTNNPIAAIISNSGTAQALKIIQNGNTSSSTSVGGSVLLDNSANTGAGLIIYSSQANPSGRLVNIRASSSTFDEAALHVDYNGTSNAVEIVANSVTNDAVPLTITNTNWTASTIGVTSDVENHGSYKSIHSFPSAGVGASGSDAVASHISLDSQGVGTAVQGIFMTSTTAGGGTSGKLLNLRNRVQTIGDVETELLTLTGDGLMGLSSATPGAVLDVAYANKTGVTAESVLFRSKSQTLTLTDGTTITNFRQNQFLAPTINGVVGGSTETVTTAATVYIDNAPSGSNITFTNGPYALLVNAGDSKFGGQVIATVFRSASGGMVNNSSGNNATINPASTGTTITRNVADANTALIVQQQHASSTGNIIDFKSGTSVVSSMNKAGVFLPVQAATASAPAYVKGGIYFDTTLNKLRIGGATAWETVTSA